ncbi:hypothetical protein [Brunnivagina elsteri]|uniref:hypothetical protein n=1 Tax=Brunnivagina elsteri TaxID=1247191 RepID=UPI001B80304A|nr:hypothetical protein [Calothrix elsteri]
MLNYSKWEKTNYKDASVCEVITTCMWNCDRTYQYFKPPRRRERQGREGKNT